MDPHAWTPAPPRAALEGDDVHVWRVPLVVPSDRLAALRQLLDAAERTRADRYVQPERGQAFVAARGALRELLGRYLGADPRELAFVCGSHGKPALAPPHGPGVAEGDAQGRAPGLRFNLSDSGEVALVALTLGREVGVDVEMHRDLHDAAGVERRVLTASERAALDALPAPERREGFFAAWARKEAVLKALGTGLSQPLEAIEVEVDPRAEARILTLDGVADPPGWTMRRLEAGPRYAAALAVRGTVGALECYALG